MNIVGLEAELTNFILEIIEFGSFSQRKYIQFGKYIFFQVLCHTCKVSQIFSFKTSSKNFGLHSKLYISAIMY